MVYAANEVTGGFAHGKPKQIEITQQLNMVSRFNEKKALYNNQTYGIATVFM